ncbi:hypothetical protein BKA69DRAFT_1123014 [Paraphysoderma sedebokerense]|nr:hypothetical protein BKA69DRAFT_1123014 [Paraphysoderma sedebokerense]
MLCSQSINVMDKVTIQYGSLRKSYDVFSLPSQMYDCLEKEGFRLPGRKTIADVPNEILTMIFQHLNKKSLINVVSVCRRFFDYGAPLLWSTPQALSNPPKTRSYELFIRNLRITVPKSLSAELCSSIHRVFGFIPDMSNLTHLNLSILTYEEPIEAVSNRMESNISRTFIELMKLPGLESLNVEPINLEIVCHVLETEYNFSLENSTISRMLFALPKIPVSGGHFQRFIQSFKVLESLALSDVGALGISLWAEILSSETITCLEVDFAQFQIFDNPPVLLPSKLESLSLQDVSSESETLRVFLSPLSLLTRLEFLDCLISNIGEISPIADVIPQLENIFYSSNADTFGPLFFRGFAYPNSRLRKLSIHLSLDDEDVLREFMGIPTLEEACFVGVEVSPTRLAEFLQINTGLRHLEIHSCPLHPTYLLPLFTHCPNIETFTTYEPVLESMQVLDKVVRNHSNLCTYISV